MTEINKDTVSKYVWEYCRVHGVKYKEQLRFPDFSGWITRMHSAYKKKIGKRELYSPSFGGKEEEEYYNGFCEFLENISQQEAAE